MQKKYLFFDRQWIRPYHNCWMPKGEFRFKIFPPKKLSYPVVIADKPWESTCLNCHNIIYDGGKYRLWYAAIDKNFRAPADLRLCYAESDNLIDWKKPDLGIVEYRGSRKNNIVFDGNMSEGTGFGGQTVFIDPSAKPSERYKMIFSGALLGSAIKKIVCQIVSTAYSSDGIRWWMRIPLSKSGGSALNLLYGSDTQTVCHWDERLKKYVGFFRYWDPYRNRAIARAETSNFDEWRLPKQILRCDDKDPLWLDMYTNAGTKYENGDYGYFFFPAMYNHLTDTLNAQVATSRDSYLWERCDRSVYIENGRKGSFDAGQIYVAPGILRYRGGLAISYHGMKCHHNETYPDKISYQGGVGIATMPVDRIQGLCAEKNFEFSLYPFTPEKENFRILINAKVNKDGEIRVAIPDSKTNSYKFAKGAGFGDCVPVKGDVTSEEIRWKKTLSLKNIIGKKTELRILLKRAVLYSLTIE